MSADTERCVKYMAKSPAKNMSSLDSQTMVPTETVFGRLTFTWGALGAAVVDDTLAIMARLRGVVTTPPVRDSQPFPREGENFRAISRLRLWSRIGHASASHPGGRPFRPVRGPARCPPPGAA